MKSIRPASLFFIFLAACSGSSIEDSFTQEQRVAVSDLLRKHPHAELAQASDCTSPNLARYQSEHPGYRPYYAEEDFTGDGSLDFVIATKSAGAYDLWLFPGSGLEYHSPQNFATLTWLHEGGFIVRDDTLYVGRFYEDVGNRYTWSNAANRFAIISADQQ